MPMPVRRWWRPSILTSCLLAATGIALTGCYRTPQPAAAEEPRIAKSADEVRLGRFDSAFEFTGMLPATRLYIYDGLTGDPIVGETLQKRLEAADVILLGEIHIDPTAHRLQEWFVQAALPGSDGSGALSLEMLDRSAGGRGIGLDEESLAQTSLANWTHWRQFYLPVIEAAQESGVPVVAANAVRDYVVFARANGYEALRNLDPESRRYFDLPPDGPYAPYLADYRRRFLSVIHAGHGMAPDDPTEQAPAVQPGDPGIPDDRDFQQLRNFLDGPSTRRQPEMELSYANHQASFSRQPATRRTTLPARQSGRTGTEPTDYWEAQLVWDATMAESITGAYAQFGGPIVHLVGSMHSDYDGGLTTLLRRRGFNVLTVSFVPIDAGRLRPEDVGRADIVIYTGPLPAPEDARREDEGNPFARSTPTLGEGAAAPSTVPATRPSTLPTTRSFRSR